MRIKYADGSCRDAVLVSRSTNNTMRVVLQGNDDATLLNEVNCFWFLENLEPVQLEFAWQRRAHSVTPALSDCVCSAELATRLVDLLYSRAREGKLEFSRTLLAAGSPSL